MWVAFTLAASLMFLRLDKRDRGKVYGEELVAHAYKHALRPFYAAGLCVRGSLATRHGEAETGVGLLRSGLDEMQKAIYLLFDPFFRAELAVALGATGHLDHGISEIAEALPHTLLPDYP